MTDPQNPDASAPKAAEPVTDGATDPVEQPATRPPVERANAVYSPAPTPRPDWASAEAEPWPADVAPGTPVAQMAPVAPLGASGGPNPAPATRGDRRSGPGTLLAVALLSAVLASGGTVLGLSSAGLIGVRQGGTSNGPVDSVSTSQQPLTIDESSAVIDAAAKVSPAVVRILVGGATPDEFGNVPTEGVGSGVIYDSNGWILTNRHVVRDSNGQLASSLTVELKDGREFKGTVYGIDTLTDLAIVRIDAKDLASAPIGSSSELKVGQLAIAIGSPLGTYSNTVTSGIISATGRSVTVDATNRLSNLIQTDAAINPGNSGGPLLDAAGNVVGINTAVARDSTGIGFAIPIDLARPIMQQALAGETLSRPYIGIRYETIDLKVKARDNLPVDHGALIAPSQDANGTTLPAIIAGGPAEKAGLKAGDIITAINDRAIDPEHPLDATLAGFAPSQSVEVHILRDGKPLTFTVVLGTRPSGL